MNQMVIPTCQEGFDSLKAEGNMVFDIFILAGGSVNSL